MLEALGDAKGLAPVRAGALFYWDPGVQVTAQVQGGFDASGPYYQSNNCLIQGTLISELLDLRLRKVIVELLTGLPLRSLVAPSSRGRRIMANHQ